MAGGEAATPLLDCMRHNRDCVCDGDEMTCHVIGYFDAKFILDRYDEFHKIHRLGAQVINISEAACYKSTRPIDEATVGAAINFAVNIKGAIVVVAVSRADLLSV